MEIVQKLFPNGAFTFEGPDRLHVCDTAGSIVRLSRVLGELNLLGKSAELAKLKVFSVPPGSAEAIARLLAIRYRQSADVRITVAGNQLFVQADSATLQAISEFVQDQLDRPAPMPPPTAEP